MAKLPENPIRTSKQRPKHVVSAEGMAPGVKESNTPAKRSKTNKLKCIVYVPAILTI